MKNIKFLILFLAMGALTISCETYDDYDKDRPTVAGFTIANKNIRGIPTGGQKSEVMTVFVSDVSSAARTLKIISVPVPNPDENPPASPANYSFDSTVTIPANEREGTVTITGIDGDGTLSSDRTFFRLEVEGGDDIVSGGKLTVGIQK